MRTWYTKYKTTRRRGIRLSMQCCGMNRYQAESATQKKKRDRPYIVAYHQPNSVPSLAKKLLKTPLRRLFSCFCRAKIKSITFRILSFRSYHPSCCLLLQTFDQDQTAQISRLETNTRSTRGIQTATAARRLYRHHRGVPSTTTPIPGLVPNYVTNSDAGTHPRVQFLSCWLNNFNPACLHIPAHYPTFHPPSRRPTPYAWSKQVPSNLRRTQTPSLRCESMLCFPDGVLAVGQLRQ